MPFYHNRRPVFLYIVIFVITLSLNVYSEDDPKINHEAEKISEAERLLADVKTRQKALGALANLAKKNKDSTEKFEATALLAQAEREDKKIDKAIELLKNFSDYDKISSVSTYQLKSSYIMCFLELAHCYTLEKNEKQPSRVREAFKMLDYAENNTMGIDKVRSQYKYGAVLFDMNEFNKADIYLNRAIETANAYFKDIKEDSSGEKKPILGLKDWQKLKPQIDELLFPVSIELLKEEYGEGYALYVKMRSYYDKGEFYEAFPVAEKLMKDFSDEIYGEAGRFYWCKMLIGNDYAGDLKDKNLPSGVKELNNFIKDKPYGLYRGEAWMELGRTSLEHKWDADESSDYWNKALNWFRTIREKKNTVELYTIPEKVKRVAVSEAPFSSLNNWYMTVYRQASSKEIDIANPNYLNAKEKECLFMVGFFMLMNGDSEKAKACFEQIKTVDADMAMLESKNFPNAFRRLKTSAESGFMVFPPEEKRFLKGRNKLRVMYAELKYMMEKFNDARNMFQEVIDDPKSSKEEKAIAYIGIGNCSDMTVMPKTKEERLKEAEYYKEAISLSGKTPVAGNALVCLGNYLQGSTRTADMGNEYFEEYIKRYPDGRYIELAMHRLAHAYTWQGKISQAKELFEKLKEKNPDSLFVKHLSHILEKEDNNRKEKGNL